MLCPRKKKAYVPASPWPQATGGSSTAIKKEFQIDDPKPFEFKGNCEDSISEKYIEIVNDGEKFEYYLLAKIRPKCVRFQPVSNEGDMAVCVNNELSAYEIEYKGNNSDLL